MLSLYGYRSLAYLFIAIPPEILTLHQHIWLKFRQNTSFEEDPSCNSPPATIMFSPITFAECQALSDGAIPAIVGLSHTIFAKLSMYRLFSILL